MMPPYITLLFGMMIFKHILLPSNRWSRYQDQTHRWQWLTPVVNHYHLDVFGTLSTLSTWQIIIQTGCGQIEQRSRFFLIKCSFGLETSSLKEKNGTMLSLTRLKGVAAPPVCILSASSVLSRCECMREFWDNVYFCRSKWYVVRFGLECTYWKRELNW